MTLRIATTDELSSAERNELRALFDEAWRDEGFPDEDWDHAIGGSHFLLEVDGTVRSHASVVERVLEVDGRPVHTGYVEAVATRQPDRRRGYATEVMRAVTTYIDEHLELGALGTDLFDFYGRLGWERWRGPLSVRTDAGPVRTPEEDGFVMVRRTLATPPGLDLDAPLSCEWRPGDVW